jgi:hypothetical protein
MTGRRQPPPVIQISLTPSSGRKDLLGVNSSHDVLTVAEQVNGLQQFRRALASGMAASVAGTLNASSPASPRAVRNLRVIALRGVV